MATDDIKTWQYDLMVFIGRMQPFHNGHLEVVSEALNLGKHVLLLLGSSLIARNPYNPFTFQERELMIRSCFSAEENARMIIRPLVDRYNDTSWGTQVHERVNEVVFEKNLSEEKICLIGHNKDGSSYYLAMFPEWASRDVAFYMGLSATDVRNAMYLKELSGLKKYSGNLPPSVLQFLELFLDSPAFAWLLGEYHEYLDKYRVHDNLLGSRRAFINTADAVVTQSSHLLVVERTKRPGLGLFSLPGSILKDNMGFLDTVVSALVDDHGLLVSPDCPRRVASENIKAYMGNSMIFDHPYRSYRGRVISRVFRFEMKNSAQGLPKLRKAPMGKPVWIQIAKLKNMQDRFMEDHYEVIRQMGILG
jgi:bifunctional NMN adenylyltransferase/nudix hydrolase